MRKQFRPLIDPDVGREFKAFCEDNGLIIGTAATKALVDWLKRQKQTEKSEATLVSSNPT
ncbi:hypothetical protein [Stenomitos frigidus]|uniref:Uncharacterized protein n=1 Tax=Stenomitos frigidus ULC18 TaxID=2107698 RepID=A0A2T1DY19_9CYAN|nr:hypothetical protein [Stenomitos frigidus]PSB25372.1 hypothetical protein C7B82_23880 [Stenomitos frigidus ULC18]